MKALDIGSAECAYKPEGYEVTHIDVQDPFEPGALDVRADAHWLPFEDDSFDMVWSGCCLVVYTDEDAVKEAIRVLKDGGKFKARIQVEYMLEMVELLIDNGIDIVDVEPWNYEDGKICDVIIDGVKR